MDASQVTPIIELARKHVEDGDNVLQPGSAKVALADAEKLLAEGRCTLASSRALKSLSYSVGVFHPAWRKANSMISAAD